MDNIYIHYINMPASIKAYTLYNGEDDCYHIFINAGLSFEMQDKSKNHEISHITNHDFDRCDCDVQYIESLRHGE